LQVFQPPVFFTVLDVEGFKQPLVTLGFVGVVSKAHAWDLMRNIETEVTRFIEMKQGG
jgi:hypothetical protein